MRPAFASALMLALIALGAPQLATADDALEIKVGFVKRIEHRETISLIDMPSVNDGLAGAQLAIADNNTTGTFLNQRYALESVQLAENGDVVEAIRAFAEHGVKQVIADVSAADVLKAADAAKPLGILVFNSGAPDDRLREEDCRADVVHTAPTRSMLADALGEYLVWKKWTKWLLVVGSHEGDKLFGDALRRSAKKFGAKIVEERAFQDTGGSRRTDSGIVQVQRQMPDFTQSAPAYDVLAAADENDVFAAYLPYRTWDPRPVVGSAGLMPTSWDPAHDQWGAVQIQNHFLKMFSRPMKARDMQAWTAARMIGEAVSHTKSADSKAVLDFLRGPDFALGAYKGQQLTLRVWNQQLRQPILLSDGRTVVSVSPQEGFLHQVSELDTLGYDQPETKCKLQ